MAYWDGVGVQPDRKEAMKLFRQAAKKHDPVALFGLGYAYDLGAEVQQDYRQAAKLYREAADHGHSEAMNNLGLLYEHGRGVNVDVKQALRLYEQAANLGSPLAAANLARLYASGVLGSKDDLQACVWLVIASREDTRYLAGVERLRQSMAVEKWQEIERAASEKWEAISKNGVPPLLLGNPPAREAVVAQK